MKRALITGITGQDGALLAEQLIGEGWEVHGIIRRASSFNTARLEHLYQEPHEPHARLKLHYGDMTDAASLEAIVRRVEATEIYHLAAQSHVGLSFEMPDYTAEVVALGTLRLLEAVRKLGKPCRFYQASSSEMFGSAGAPQSETTEFRPQSPYAAAKVFAHHLVQHYRQAYGLFAVAGILFNHEGITRSETFVTRKITRAVGRIKHGLQEHLWLGNLAARRDWGWAPDYVRAMTLMLRREQPRDYVIGTGVSHTVQSLCEIAFDVVGLDWRKHVREDARYRRPAEVPHLEADARRAREELPWQPTINFEGMIGLMVHHDLDLARQEAAAPERRPPLWD